MVKEGDTVEYATWGGPIREVTITGVYEEVKNGRPGFDGEMSGGQRIWGYNDQILKVNGRKIVAAAKDG